MKSPQTSAKRDAFRAQGLAGIIEGLACGVCVIDADGVIRLVNATLEENFGYSRETLVGQSIDVLVPERYRHAHPGHREAFLHDPSRRTMGGRQVFGLRSDGTEFPIEVGLNPLQLEGRRVIVASISDVSERFEVERSLASVVQATPTAAMLVKADGRIALVNRQAEIMFGFEAGAMEDMPVEDLLPVRYRAGHPEARANYLKAPSVRAMGQGRDLTALHRDEREIPVEVGLNAIHFGGVRMVLVSMMDLTERKKLELSLRQANQHLEEFTYVASHDLRSPLRGIANLSEWISENLDAGQLDKARTNLQRLHVRVERMETIIDDLLAYARAGRRSRELVDVDPLAILKGIDEILPRPEAMQIHYMVDVKSFKAPHIPLETVLRNLIGNAIKHHTSERGCITVRVMQDDADMLFEVSDDGPGIAAAVHKRIFKLFQTVSASERQGSGIGLALSKRLVEAHGGSICVKNNDPEPGATFVVRWPRFPRRDLDGE